MKILVLSTMYPNSVMYLSGIFVHEQVKALSKVGVEVKVIAPVPYSPFPLKHFSKKWSLYSEIPQFEIIDEINVYHSRYLAIPRGILKDYWHFFYNFSVLHHFNITNGLQDFDIIHCHGTLPNDYAAYLLSRKFDKPFVITVHGETVYQIIHQKRKFQKSKIAIENAGAVIGVSSQVVKRITEYTNRTSNLFTVLNGYSTDSSLITKSSVEDKIFILFSASLIKRKGCDYTLRAFSKLYKKYLNTHLIIAGGGELLNDMKQYSRELGLDQRVTFTGTISHSEMLKKMAACDIFILPSYDEAFGVVYLEAMSFKKPVIGTEGEGIEDIIKDGENGLLVKPRDVASIVEKLELLIRSPKLRNELGIKGFNSIKNLTWENNAREMIKIYERLISEK